ncbi:MAG: LacI family DNA-binding transcriptional regulator [Sphingomonadales bacterium]|nr:LacI family DNA-binding transcriptional regulator [Sphingomonadales bacterium]MDE2570428.1 LacI family DNA-binding transcriptional regulator [Sphingomonadales bacterium]
MRHEELVDVAAPETGAMRRPATMVDVAETAGVSLKTVSRVINGGENVRPRMRERVEAAIRALNYHPSLAARQLSGQRSYILTLIAPRAGVSYVARMMVAIATEAQARGYHVMTELIETSGSNVLERLAESPSARSDAYILMPPFQDDPALLARLAAEGTPAVRIAGISEGYGVKVEIDDAPAAEQVVDHLLELGHRRIGMVGPPLPRRAAETRVDGYMRALGRAGIEIDPDLVVRGSDLYFGAGANAALELLALTNKPTAIFAASDELALGVMVQAQRLGYSIPGDLALAGFDDSPMSRMVFPALTTVHQRIREIARVAVETALSGVVPADADLSARLLVRGSTTGDRSLCLEPFQF